jgi:hypothetical protein
MLGFKKEKIISSFKKEDKAKNLGKIPKLGDIYKGCRS